ncbi:MAG: hypothetical protein E7E58_01055 [Paeniclostridium sordellii]|nr:hypothetical protein [Paeniclostridium sordellii]
MRGRIKSEIWKRSGISVLWELPPVIECIRNSEVITLNQLFRFSVEGWPENLPSFSDSAIIVSGLEYILDLLSPSEAKEWLDQRLYPLLLEFQKEYEGYAALIFVIPQGDERIKYITVKDTFYWICNCNDKEIPFSSSLWNGAEKDAKYIDIDKYIKCGLYHPRIS